MAKKPKGNGAELFEAYYGDLFGARWAALREALLGPVRQESIAGPGGTAYWLDAGSKEAASALSLPESGSILDMCAAPGGKSLVLAARMGEDTTLVSNEMSAERKNRLVRVLDEFLDPRIRARVAVTGRDAARWSRYEQESYEGILLDAPCSSERHVLSSPPHLAEWSPARVKNLAYRQWALLSGAWLVLKPEGCLVYSTCALSPAENDDVVAKLLKKYGNAEVIRPVEAGCGEETSLGTHILPDTAEGAGPIYYSVIRKTRS